MGCNFVLVLEFSLPLTSGTIPDDDLENLQGNKYTGLFAGIGLALWTNQLE